MKPKKALEIILLILKILLPIVLIVPLIFLSYRLVEGRMEDLANIGNDSYYSGMGLYVFASMLLLLFVGIACLIVTGIGLLISCLYKNSPQREYHIKYFTFMIAAPFLNLLLYMLIVIITNSIGG